MCFCCFLMAPQLVLALSITFEERMRGEKKLKAPILVILWYVWWLWWGFCVLWGACVCVSSNLEDH